MAAACLYPSNKRGSASLEEAHRYNSKHVRGVPDNPVGGFIMTEPCWMTKYFVSVIFNHLLLIGVVVEMGELSFYRSTPAFYRVLALPRYRRDG